MTYKRKYPLDMVISEQCLDKYNSVFFFILKLKRLGQVLSQLWKYLAGVEFRVSEILISCLKIANADRDATENKKGIDPEAAHATLHLSLRAIYPY